MRGNPLPESCVGLFIIFCTGWILKKRIIKLVFLRKCKKQFFLKIAVFIFPLTPDRPPYFAALGFHGWPIKVAEPSGGWGPSAQGRTSTWKPDPRLGNPDLETRELETL